MYTAPQARGAGEVAADRRGGVPPVVTAHTARGSPFARLVSYMCVRGYGAGVGAVPWRGGTSPRPVTTRSRWLLLTATTRAPSGPIAQPSGLLKTRITANRDADKLHAVEITVPTLARRPVHGLLQRALHAISHWAVRQIMSGQPLTRSGVMQCSRACDRPAMQSPRAGVAPPSLARIHIGEPDKPQDRQPHLERQPRDHGDSVLRAREDVSAHPPPRPSPTACVCHASERPTTGHSGHIAGGSRGGRVDLTLVSSLASSASAPIRWAHSITVVTNLPTAGCAAASTRCRRSVHTAARPGPADTQ
jgi:hypothetical protein